jgi:serine/threonine-protein kinase
MAEGERWIDLEEGDEFAGYRIEQRLGRGGMGVLYLAIEPGLERRVALKLIAPEAAADEVFRKRFAEESKIAASIEHPNVVPIYAAGEEGDVPYIAMRYVSGSDLGRRIAREGKLDPAEAAALIAQVANGLDAIHAAGLVHRDVKPANVLLSGGEGTEPHTYITDFGVARNVATNSGLTQTGRFVGTLDYVAPEQISGREIDARVDVYALGCLLFKLLTGEVPFPKDGDAARLYAHLNDPPPAPSLFVPAVSMALDDVVIRAMSKPPEDRYPSAGDLGRAALAAVAGERVSLPERTVATGAAATRTAETIPPTVAPGGEGESTTKAAAPVPPTAEAAPPTAGTAPLAPPTAATRHLEPDPEPPTPARRRRRLALFGGLAAVAALAAIAVALSSSGGGGDSTAGAKAGGTAREKKAEPPLTGQQLIAKTDRVCLDSQAFYLQALSAFRVGETTPNVTFSKKLVGISGRAVKKFEAMVPPATKRADFKRYVDAERRVHALDLEALHAAQRDDAAAYLAARQKRDDMSGELYSLARGLGLKECNRKK